MKHYRTAGAVTFDIINTVLLVLLMIVTLYPCLYVLFASMSDSVELYQGSKILLFPRGFNLETYKIIMRYPMLWLGYKNTLVYVLLGTAVNVLLTIVGAYPLSRAYLPGKGAVMKLIVFTMMFSGGLIPSYLLVNKLGMLNKIWALIIPGAISAWNLVIMRTYFMGIPDSLEESAKIDGANDFTILFKIILPLSLPVIAVIVLYYSVGHWNSYFSALIYLRNRELYPLQLILREILIQNDSKMMQGITEDRQAVSENVKYATIVVATLPILMIYPMLQKYFVKGVMIGALKG